MGKKAKVKDDAGKEYTVDTETGEVVDTPSESVKPKKITKTHFSLNAYKQDKGLDKTNFKPHNWLNLSPAFQKATGIPGPITGGITLMRGHSDSGKSTALIEAAVDAQKRGMLPVFIISEMKWSWEHAKQMGFQIEEIKDKNGNVTGHDGFFIYVDRGQVKTIEDVAEFINGLLDDQEKGNLPHDLVFLWDSVGSLPCKMSVEKQKNNNEWNAGAMSVQFGGHINQRIVSSRKEEYPYTNTLICVNKIWVRKPDNPMGQPVMKNKGGDTMYYDSSLIITFGNVATSGINKIKATKNGKEVTFATRVRVQIEKNHVNGISTSSKIIATPTGFIWDDKPDIEKYKKENLSYLVSLLGDGEGEISTKIEEAEDVVSAYTAEPDEEL